MSTFTNFCKHLQLRIGSIEFIKTYLSMLLSTEVIFEMWFTGARDVTNLLCVGSVLAKRQDKECYNAIQEKLQAPKVKKKNRFTHQLALLDFIQTATCCSSSFWQ